MLPTNPLGRLGPRGGKPEAGRGRWGMLGAVCILVSRASGDPRSALERGLPPRERGPEHGGRAGSRRFGEISGFPSPGTRPLHPETLLGGAAPVRARGSGGGGRRQLGCCWSRGGFFSFRAPAYLHLCPFAGCWRQADPDPLLSGRVKTGTLLAAVEDNKEPHVAVCPLPALHRQTAPSPPYSLPSRRAEASRLPLPPCRPSGLQPRAPLNPSSRLLRGGGHGLCPSWGRGGKKGAIRLFFFCLFVPRRLFMPLRTENPLSFCLLIHQLHDTRRRGLSEKKKKKGNVTRCFLLSLVTAACPRASRALGFGAEGPSAPWCALQRARARLLPPGDQ